MNATMSEFLCRLVDNQFARLDELMLDKYPMFIDFYWLLKQYASAICQLQYQDHTNVLEVLVSVETSSNEWESMVNALKSAGDNNRSLTYGVDNKAKTLTIRMQ